MILPPGSIFICGHGHLALYALRPLVSGEIMSPDDVMIPDGTRPKNGENVICWKCGYALKSAWDFKEWKTPDQLGPVCYLSGNWMVKRK